MVIRLLFSDYHLQTMVFTILSSDYGLQNIVFKLLSSDYGLKTMVFRLWSLDYYNTLFFLRTLLQRAINFEQNPKLHGKNPKNMPKYFIVNT